jgi:hypothetical protein
MPRLFLSRIIEDENGRLGQRFADDGTFWMSAPDFHRAWSHVDAVRLFPPSWRMARLAARWQMPLRSGDDIDRYMRSTGTLSSDGVLEVTGAAVPRTRSTDNRPAQLTIAPLNWQ